MRQERTVQSVLTAIGSSSASADYLLPRSVRFAVWMRWIRSRWVTHWLNDLG
jgi:hypothetical protein